VPPSEAIHGKHASMTRVVCRKDEHSNYRLSLGQIGASSAGLGVGTPRQQCPLILTAKSLVAANRTGPSPPSLLCLTLTVHVTRDPAACLQTTYHP